MPSTRSAWSRCGQGCITTEGTSEAAAQAVRQAVGGGCQSGRRRLLSVTNAIEPGTWRQGDSGWAHPGRPGGGKGGASNAALGVVPLAVTSVRRSLGCSANGTSARSPYPRGWRRVAPALPLLPLTHHSPSPFSHRPPRSVLRHRWRTDPIHRPGLWPAGTEHGPVPLWLLTRRGRNSAGANSVERFLCEGSVPHLSRLFEDLCSQFSRFLRFMVRCVDWWLRPVWAGNASGLVLSGAE